MGDEKLHIVMFPWLAFGHMIPYLELAKLIAQKGNKVSFVSTPRNIDRLPKLPTNLVPYIDFVKLPLSKFDNLPENAEATSDVPYDMVPTLKKAFDGLQEPMRNFLKSSQADWVLFDFASYWVCEDSAELGINTAFFSIFIAAVVVFLGPPPDWTGESSTPIKPEQYTITPSWIPFSTPVRFRHYEFMKIVESFNPKDSDVSDLQRLGWSIRNCDIVAIRSCFEFESEWLRVAETVYQKAVIPVGQLPTTASDDIDDDTKTWQWMKAWLDKQEQSSVIYIAFGSEAKLSQDELNQIALGLEKSDLPFIWVLRVRRGEHDPDELKLPEGFSDRTKGRGLVWTGWAPQLKIIAHEAIGIFLSHSGWSSVVEAIQFEKSLVLLPCFADQGLNSRVLDEKKLAYPIPRDEHDGSFTSDDVAESLKLVLLKEEGQIYRENIKTMKDIFVNKEKQDLYVADFLNYLKANRNPRNIHKE